METKKKWYQTTGGIIALLILFFPAGLYLMWKHATWNKTAKWIVTGVFAFFVLVSAFSPDSTETSNTASQNTTPAVTQEAEPTAQPETDAAQEQAVEPTKAPVNATNTPAAQTQQAAPATGETVSQKNAVKKAKSYLNYTGFSRDGLVAQLEYDQFSNADAVYGADNAGGNWMEEAAQKAKAYMEYSAFSRGSLIEQLKYDKFTQEQAEYGANSVGL